MLMCRGRLSAHDQGYFATAVIPLDAEAVWRGGGDANALALAAVEVLVDSGAECVGRWVLRSRLAANSINRNSGRRMQGAAISQALLHTVLRLAQAPRSDRFEPECSMHRLAKLPSTPCGRAGLQSCADRQLSLRLLTPTAAYVLSWIRVAATPVEDLATQLRASHPDLMLAACGGRDSDAVSAFLARPEQAEYFQLGQHPGGEVRMSKTQPSKGMMAQSAE